MLFWLRLISVSSILDLADAAAGEAIRWISPAGLQLLTACIAIGRPGCCAVADVGFRLQHVWEWDVRVFWLHDLLV